MAFSSTSREIPAPRTTAPGSPSHTAPEMALVVAEVRDAATPRCAQPLGQFLRAALWRKREKLRSRLGNLLQRLYSHEVLRAQSLRNPRLGMAQTLQGKEEQIIPSSARCVPKRGYVPSARWQKSSHAGTQPRACGNSIKQGMGN